MLFFLRFIVFKQILLKTRHKQLVIYLQVGCVCLLISMFYLFSGEIQKSSQNNLLYLALKNSNSDYVSYLINE